MFLLATILKDNPEHAKHDWEKEFVNNLKDKVRKHYGKS